MALRKELKTEISAKIKLTRKTLQIANILWDEGWSGVRDLAERLDL